MCSCPFGQSGAVCKHQIAVSETHMMALPQTYMPTKENRRALAAVALGDSHVSSGFFSCMRDLSTEDAASSMEADESKEEPELVHKEGDTC